MTNQAPAPDPFATTPLERNLEQDPVAHAIAVWLMTVAKDFREAATLNSKLLTTPLEIGGKPVYFWEFIAMNLSSAHLVETLAHQVEKRQW